MRHVVVLVSDQILREVEEKVRLGRSTVVKCYLFSCPEEAFKAALDVGEPDAFLYQPYESHPRISFKELLENTIEVFDSAVVQVVQHDLSESSEQQLFVDRILDGRVFQSAV